MLTTLALALSVPAAPPPRPACTSTQPAERLAGRWAGVFGNAEWTLELVREGEGWSGRIQPPQSDTWRPFGSVRVTGGCVTFTLTSEPPVTFDLALSADGATLAGQAMIGATLSLPFTARRVS